MNDIYAWIDEHRGELVAELQALLRQPSISAQKIGLDECAAILRSQWIADGLPNTQNSARARRAVDRLCHRAGDDAWRQDAALLQPLRRAAAGAAGTVGGPALQRGDP